MPEKYLPIGTVVMLKGATKRLMITGFCSMPADDKNKLFDYSGCMYPEGYISSDQVALFNHDQIAEVGFLGLKDAEEEQFKLKLNELVKSYSNISQPVVSTTPTPIAINPTATTTIKADESTTAVNLIDNEQSNTELNNNTTEII